MVFSLDYHRVAIIAADSELQSARAKERVFTNFGNEPDPRGRSGLPHARYQCLGQLHAVNSKPRLLSEGCDASNRSGQFHSLGNRQAVSDPDFCSRLAKASACATIKAANDGAGISVIAKAEPFLKGGGGSRPIEPGGKDAGAGYKPQWQWLRDRLRGREHGLNARVGDCRLDRCCKLLERCFDRGGRCIEGDRCVPNLNREPVFGKDVISLGLKHAEHLFNDVLQSLHVCRRSSSRLVALGSTTADHTARKPPRIHL